MQDLYHQQYGSPRASYIPVPPEEFGGVRVSGLVFKKLVLVVGWVGAGFQISGSGDLHFQPECPST